MVDRRNLDFDTARTHLEDALQAVARIEKGEDVQDDLDHFLSSARDAMEEYPDVLPYAEEYRSALDDENPEEALRALANIAGTVREYDSDGDNFEFSYSESELDRVDEAFSNL